LLTCNLTYWNIIDKTFDDIMIIWSLRFNLSWVPEYDSTNLRAQLHAIPCKWKDCSSSMIQHCNITLEIVNCFCFLYNE